MSLLNVPAEAYAVLDNFTAAFNRRDVVAMDATLHFPHVFPGEKLVVWQEPGRLDAEFFPELIKSGWSFSRYTKREAILANEERVHFLIEYDRCREDGSIISKQSAIWIVARIGRKWGIQVRSNE